MRVVTLTLVLLVPVIGCAPSPPRPSASAIATETAVAISPTSSPDVSSPAVSPLASPSQPGRLGYDWSINRQPGSVGMPIGNVFTEPDRVVNMDLASRTVWASNDGLDWHQLPGQVTAAFAVAAAVTADATEPVRWKDRYFAIIGTCGDGDRSAEVWESVNLIEWQRSASLPRLGLRCVDPVGPLTAYRGQLMAAAMLARGALESGSYETRPVVWKSSDGHHWTTQPLEPWTTTGAGTDGSLFQDRGAIYFIHYRSSRGGATLWRSTDGRKWTRSQTNLRTALPHHVVAGGPGFVAILYAQPATIAISSNARRWRSVSVPDVGGEWADLIEAGRTLVAVAVETTSVWVSPNGLEWQMASRQWTDWGPIVWFHDHLFVFGSKQAYVSPPVPGEERMPTP